MLPKFLNQEKGETCKLVCPGLYFIKGAYIQTFLIRNIPASMSSYWQSKLDKTCVN